MSIDQMTET